MREVSQTGAIQYFQPEPAVTVSPTAASTNVQKEINPVSKAN